MPGCCIRCSKPSCSVRCTDCRQGGVFTWYCGRDCQTADWKEAHQFECAGSHKPGAHGRRLESLIERRLDREQAAHHPATFAAAAAAAAAPLAPESAAAAAAADWTALPSELLIRVMEAAGLRGPRLALVCKTWRLESKAAPKLWVPRHLSWAALVRAPPAALALVDELLLAKLDEEEAEEDELALYESGTEGAQDDNLLLLAAARLCPNVERLCLSGVVFRHVLAALGCALHHVQRIELNNLQCQPADLRLLLAGCPRLQAVDFGLYTCSDGAMQTISRHCPSLISCVSDRSMQLTSNGLVALAGRCPALEVCVANRSRVCARGIGALTAPDAVPALRRLCVRECAELTNPGSIKAALAQARPGLEVIHDLAT